jgi:hypothetical protein
MSGSTTRLTSNNINIEATIKMLKSTLVPIEIGVPIYGSWLQLLLIDLGLNWWAIDHPELQPVLIFTSPTDYTLEWIPSPIRTSYGLPK